MEKVIRGKPTSCAEICPAGAIKFGLREDLLKEAHERIEAEPERYQNYVYGENEVGGMNVLYLATSTIPLTDFGFNMDVGTESFPSLTWSALSRVPGLALYVAMYLVLVYFITHRRMPEEIDQAEPSELDLQQTGGGD